MTANEIAAAATGTLIGIALAAAALGPRRAAPAESVPAVPVDDDLAEGTARLMEALPFAAFMVDGRDRIAVFNPAAAALFGVDAERAVGRALIEVIPSVDLERMIAAARAGGTQTRDIALGSGARERFFGVSSRPYEDAVIAIAADRTAYLAGERVRREFTGNVSHELRTPLSSMKLMLETVLLADDDAEARALFLPQIAQEVERMIRIVEDLLDLARSESDTIRLRLELFDLGDLAAATVNTFAHRADAQEVELVLDAPEPVFVDADRGRIAQVLVNLLDNALRFTPPGGTVTVSVNGDADGAVLSVRDTGVGIPFLDLPRIFERFYVVDRSRSREHGGTGLGLAIAKHLVEAHGGRLEADSLYGHGATFTMRLPLAED